jgi:UDP-N-acetyl-D-mannosaminuronate dehydrogenase
MIAADQNIKNANVGILGLTFKEDCPDLRNSKVVDVIDELKTYGVNVWVHDPVADAGEAQGHYGIDLFAMEDMKDLDALVLAVAAAAALLFLPSGPSDADRVVFEDAQAGLPVGRCQRHR